MTKNKSGKANSNGLINCLRQPGLLLNQLPKSMRDNSISIYQTSATRTVPSTGTESVGLLSLACGYGEQSRPTPLAGGWCLASALTCEASSWVFCSRSRLFHRDPKVTTLTRTWYHGTASSCTRTLQPSARTCKNRATATQMAPN
jgi:hypothetical protein